MKKRTKEILVPFVLGVVVLFIFGYRAVSAQIVSAEMLGLLIGLFFGQIGVHIYGLASLNSKYKKISQRYYLFALFGVVLITVYFSKYFSFGYFGGFGSIICFGHSFFALLSRKEKGSSREYQS